MRFWLAASLIVLVSIAPAAGAAKRAPAASDAYYACIIGKGAVELQYGVEINDALKSGVASCSKLRTAAAKAGEGADYVEGNAAVTLMKIAGVED